MKISIEIFVDFDGLYKNFLGIRQPNFNILCRGFQNTKICIDDIIYINNHWISKQVFIYKVVHCIN